MLNVNNTVNLIGNLTKDIEMKTTQNGTEYARFQVACKRYEKEGESVDYISCVAWGKNAKYLDSYAKKGSKVAVLGSIKTGSYDDKNGNKVYTTDVVVDSVTAFTSGNQSANTEKEEKPKETTKKIELEEDLLPF